MPDAAPVTTKVRDRACSAFTMAVMVAHGRTITDVVGNHYGNQKV
jgi:hypothetical protein